MFELMTFSSSKKCTKEPSTKFSGYVTILFFIKTFLSQVFDREAKVFQLQHPHGYFWPHGGHRLDLLQEK